LFILFFGNGMVWKWAVSELQVNFLLPSWG